MEALKLNKHLHHSDSFSVLTHILQHTDTKRQGGNTYKHPYFIECLHDHDAAKLVTKYYCHIQLDMKT